MQLDDQLRRYFGETDLETITPAVLESGIEHMRVDFGLEKDRGRKFALWALLHMFGAAPDLDVAFKEAEDRDLARKMMELVEKGQGDLPG